jgi:hypothetical protein
MVGVGFTVTFEVDALAVQPFAAVTVTVYTPLYVVSALVRIGFCVFAVYDAGPLQA